MFDIISLNLKVERLPLDICLLEQMFGLTVIGFVLVSLAQPRALRCCGYDQ